MVNLPSLIIYSTEHDPVSVYDISCQRHEHTSRRTVHSLLLVAVLNSENLQRGHFILRVENGARLLAGRAPHTVFFVDLWKEKPLSVLMK